MCALFEALGYTVFFLLRFLTLIPKIEPFNEKNANKILLVRVDRIGDLILSTPAIRAVRSKYPGAEIHLLATEYTKDIVANNPNIDKVLIYQKDKIECDYDLAFALNPDLRHNYLAFKSGAKYRVGYFPSYGSFFMTHKLKNDRAERIRHELESDLELVGVMGCKTEDKKLEISLSEAGEKYVDKYFEINFSKGDVIAVIHPGARQEYIRWGKDKFVEIADKLMEMNIKVIFVGGREEEELVTEIILQMHSKPHSALGLNLIQLISLIKRCSLFVGNSSGPMHIASALNIPVVAVFVGVPLDSCEVWGPWNSKHEILTKKLNCVDCHPSDCRSFECINSVSTRDVLAAVKRQLNRT